jgi:sec-independent protein translocase protein TatA
MPELLVVLVVVLLLFGSAKLPKLARSLGASVTEFKKGIKGGEDEADDEDKPRGDEKKLNVPKDEPAKSE